MILEEILSDQIPEMFGYMIIDQVFVSAGEKIAPGTKLMLVNTKIGKYRILSPCHGRIHVGVPEIGDRIGVDPHALLYIEVEKPLADDECQPIFQKAVENEADLSPESSLNTAFPDESQTVETDFTQAEPDEPQEEQKPEKEPAIDEVEKKKFTFGSHMLGVFWSMLFGLGTGYFFYGDSFSAVSPLVTGTAFGVVFVWNLIVSFGHIFRGIILAAIFAGTLYSVPYIPLDIDLEKGEFNYSKQAVFDGKLWTPPLEDTWSKIKKVDNEEMTREKVLKRLDIRDANWVEEKNKGQNMFLKYKIKNNSNQVIRSVTLDPFRTKKKSYTHEFRYPLFPGISQEFEIVIKRAKDGKPADTLGREDNKRWLRWDNTQTDVIYQPYNREAAFFRGFFDYINGDVLDARSVSVMTEAELEDMIEALIAHFEIIHVYQGFNLRSLRDTYLEKRKMLATGALHRYVEFKVNEALHLLSKGIKGPALSHVYKKDYERERLKINQLLKSQIPDLFSKNGDYEGIELRIENKSQPTPWIGSDLPAWGASKDTKTGFWGFKNKTEEYWVIAPKLLQYAIFGLGGDFNLAYVNIVKRTTCKEVEEKKETVGGEKTGFFKYGVVTEAIIDRSGTILHEYPEEHQINLGQPCKP